MTSLKQLFIIALFIQVLFAATLSAATPEQIEEYLSISNAEEELLNLESEFSAMQNGFSQDNNASENETYDMQMLSLRFKEYIQTHLSENEMEEVLQTYKNVIFLQFISATSVNIADSNETESYINTLKGNPESGVRIELVEKINSEINNKESMIVMFDELMKPLMLSAKGGENLDDEYMKQRREAYMKSMIESSNNETLYSTKDFSIEELEKLLEISQTPAIGYEVKTIYGATAYALKEFFLSMANRYDISKH